MVNDIVKRYLHEAVRRQDQELVVSFLRLRNDVNGMDADARDGYGMTALMWAVGHGCVEIAESLLQYGADIEARNDLLSVVSIEKLETGKSDYWSIIDQMGMLEASKHHGWSALAWAARNGQTESVSLLLDRGANINAITKDGFTALVHAISNKHTETSHLLLERGADPSLIEDGASPAFPLAASFGFVDSMQIMLYHGGKIDAVDNFGHAAIGNAVANNQPEVLRLLLRHGGDVNAICPGAAEWPPLHFAAAQDSFECAEILLHAGADVDAKDVLNEMTALEFALDEMVGPRVARLLIERGADTKGALDRIEYFRRGAEVQDTSKQDIAEADGIIQLLKDQVETAAKNT